MAPCERLKVMELHPIDTGTRKGCPYIPLFDILKGVCKCQI